MPKLPSPSQLELEKDTRTRIHARTHPRTRARTCAHTVFVFVFFVGPCNDSSLFLWRIPTQIHNQTSLIRIMFPPRQRSKQSDSTKEIKKAPAGIAKENQTHQTRALSFVLFFFLMSFKLGPIPLEYLANARLPKVPFLPLPCCLLAPWLGSQTLPLSQRPSHPRELSSSRFSLGWCLLTVLSPSLSRSLSLSLCHPSLSAINTHGILSLLPFAIWLPSPSLPWNHSVQSHNQLLVLILFDPSVAFDPKDRLPS